MNHSFNIANYKKDVTELKILIVVPCLNEQSHLKSILTFLTNETRCLDAEIVVADGGSSDGSQQIVTDFAATNPRVHLLINLRKIQSSAINLAVKAYGDGKDFLIRIDAHCGYPSGFIPGLLDAAIANNVCSVVVPMKTVGSAYFQRAVASAQNSKFGNGGSEHRLAVTSRYVDHGHHALMLINAFRAVGGYDESFKHNEDAELDIRLGKAGGKIWLEGSQVIEYYPRESPSLLLRQYYNYGKGRARNTLKHRTIPKLRQSIPLSIAPLVFLAFLSYFWWPLAIPALAWLALCLGYGVKRSLSSGRLVDLLIGPALAIMHFGWSVGFLDGLVRHLLFPDHKPEQISAVE